MPWHRDPFHRVSVVLRGDALAIEYRDGGETERFEVGPGEAGWDEPTDRLHRGVNVGENPYEEITVFFLDRPDAVPQPGEGQYPTLPQRPKGELAGVDRAPNGGSSVS
jgi:hypothetical protein